MLDWMENSIPWFSKKVAFCPSGMTSFSILMDIKIKDWKEMKFESRCQLLLNQDLRKYLKYILPHIFS